MKKAMSLFMAMFILMTSFVQVYADSTYSIEVSNLNTLVVNNSDSKGSKRVLVEKDGEKYYYTLNSSKEILPLQLGAGNYSVKILENISGNKYKVLSKDSFNVSKFNESDTFLVSAQPVVWEKNGQVEKLAKDLTVGMTNDKEKVVAIYDYIVKNIKYDFNKINGLKDDYVPNNIDTLKTLSGICYDYSSLYAAMLRSLNISTKLVKGYKSDIDSYHAWNEVLLDGNWVIVDTTYDSAFVKANKDINMIKSASEYNKVREY